jgi:UDP-N-acetylglucosamine 2-epimerase (hydrolysing)
MLSALMIFGTRPELIKLGPVHRALMCQRSLSVDVFWSGQHIELVKGLLELFEISVSHKATDVMSHAGLTEKTGHMMIQLGTLLRQKRYDWIILQGDTATAMAGATAGFLNHIPVAHVEAGLRTRNLYSPWPEEFNRRVISICSQLHFAPTAAARDNLLSEGVDAESILVTGNTVIDALEFVSARVRSGYVPQCPEIRDIPADKKLLLVTGHRRENFGEPLHRFTSALAELADDGDKSIVFPVHLNPNVRDHVFARLAGRPNIHLVEPLQYPDFVYLLSRAWVVITDSGGVQEEAPTFHIPIVITRDTTERPEVIEAGFGHLVGCDQNAIVESVRRFTLGDRPHFIAGRNPFGQGDAADQIAKALVARPRGRQKAGNPAASAEYVQRKIASLAQPQNP